MFLIIMKGGIHQSNILIYSIIINHSWLSDYIALTFLYFSEYIMIKKAVIIFIIKPILLKL